MAQVPYSPVPDIAPSVPGAPRVGIETPPAAFGAATAAATQRFGGQLEESANQMAATALYVKQLQNETWAKNEFVNQSQKLGQIESDFYSKKGAAAVAAQGQYANDVRNLYENSIANAPNPQAARFLGDSLSRRISYSLVDGQRHAGEQNQQYMKVTSENRVAEAQSTAAQHTQPTPQDDQLFRDQLATVRSEAQAQAEQFGEGQDGYNKRVEHYVSQTWDARLRAIGFDDPQRALAMLDANKDQIKGIMPNGQSYAENIREFLQHRNNIVGADQDAERILHPQGIDVYNDKTLTPGQRVGTEPLPPGYKSKGGGEELGPDSGPDFLENAIKKAREVGKPYGAEYTQHLVAQVENKYRQFNTAYRMEEYGNFTNLSGAITGANGTAPITDRNSLLSNPVLYQQYESLGQTARGKTMQQRLLTMIDKNSTRGSLNADQQRALVDRIRGFGIEAQKDPAARDEFIKMDWGDLYSKVDPGLKNTLSSEQEKVRTSWAKMGITPGQDRTAEVIASLKPMMDSAGIKRDPNNKAANSQYFEFVGALSAKIQAQEAVTGKQLSDKEINDIAAALIQRIGGIGQAVKNNGGVGAPKPTPNVPQASM